MLVFFFLIYIKDKLFHVLVARFDEFVLNFLSS